MENIELSEVKKKILGEIKRDTNGAVVELMSEMNQGEVFFSYGVTVVKIKEVAKEYKPNHLLAMELFDSKIRELKLAAIYIDSPQEVTQEQMMLWSESFDSLEIMEHAASMLFYASSFALEIATQWAKSQNQFIQKAAYLMALKRVKLIYSENEIEHYKTIYNHAIESLIARTNRYTISTAENFVAALANKNSDVKERLIIIVKCGEMGDSGGEIMWQI